MKVAILGWYGHNNAGDERIKHCLNSYLKKVGGIDSITFFDLHENAIQGGIASRNFDVYDLIIIGGGGLVLSRNNYHDFIRELKPRVVTLGISIETTLSGNPKKFVEALKDKSSHFLVRDMESAKLINRGLGKDRVKASSDLTFLDPFAFRKGKSERETLGINLLPKPMFFDYAKLSYPSVSLSLELLEKLRLTNFIPHVNFNTLIKCFKERYFLKPIPLYCAKQKAETSLFYKNDIEFLRKYFSTVPRKFNHFDIDMCHSFFSMRLHGAIFSVQKGVPIISFGYLPKNRNFMRSVGLEEYLVNEYKPNEIIALVEKSIKCHSELVDKMAYFRDTECKKIKKDVSMVLNN